MVQKTSPGRDVVQDSGLFASTAKQIAAATQENAPTEKDDTLTGFDYLNGHLETLSGDTFLVRPGEQDMVHMWSIKVEVEGGKQPVFI